MLLNLFCFANDYNFSKTLYFYLYIILSILMKIARLKLKYNRKYQYVQKKKIFKVHSIFTYLSLIYGIKYVFIQFITNADI